MLKRILLVLTVAVVMAAMMALAGGPAFAKASDKASCQGQDLSFVATGEPGSVGEAFGSFAPEFGQKTGESQSNRARNHPRNACSSQGF